MSYTHQFLHIPNLALDLAQKLLVGPRGSKLLRSAQRDEHPVYAWTVNSKEWMEWCLQRNLSSGGGGGGNKRTDGAGVAVIDGVITDDPKLFLDVCEKWEDQMDKNATEGAGSNVSSLLTWRQILELVLVNVFVTVFHVYQRHYKGWYRPIRDPKLLAGR